MDAPNRMTPKASWTWCVSQFGVVSIEEKTIGKETYYRIEQSLEHPGWCILLLYIFHPVVFGRFIG